ncbi:MAG: metal ABC transporter permease [Patescibacteria group bacterium]|nr:metal ABC transporter permease [Patescibacteria group bacterium]
MNTLFLNIIILANITITKAIATKNIIMVINPNLIIILISAVFVAIASGLISSFLVLRRMTLVSDALSHVALPGIALGIILKFQPIIGGLIFLFVGVLIIWRLEFQTKLAAESLTGVVFTTALAIGSLMASETDLLEAFFGSISNITLFQIVVQTVLALVVIFITLKYLKKIVLFSIAPDLSYSVGLSNQRIELILLLILALTMSIGISFVGVLLMSSLLIIPAVTARQLVASFKGFVELSVILATVDLLGGIIISVIFKVQPGIATTLIGSAIFALSLIIPKRY